MNIELMIGNDSGSKLLQPSVEEGIEWSTQRRSAPGKLTFRVVKDSVISFQEGAPVRLKVDGTPVFFGFVFTKKRDKGGLIDVTAYDQLRYLKNKDTCIYENKTASELIRMLAAASKLQTGLIEDTGFKIATGTEQNSTLFDVIENALDATLTNKKEMFVLFDDFGKLILKNIKNMKLDLLIDEETGENFDYSTSIDDQTYNQVRLYPKDGGNPAEAKNAAHISKWGVLQYSDSFDGTKENGQAKAASLLSLYDAKTRSLTISHAFGDLRARAGCLLGVQLNLGDVEVRKMMMIEKVKHTFLQSQHFMDITLRGGEFIA